MSRRIKARNPPPESIVVKTVNFFTIANVVNNRLLSGKPMIITTNIPLSVMQKATDLDDRRIYDRILEVCVPVVFGGDSFRKTNAADNMQKAARYLNGASH